MKRKEARYLKKKLLIGNRAHRKVRGLVDLINLKSRYDVSRR
jgi:hypothetical protein